MAVVFDNIDMKLNVLVIIRVVHRDFEQAVVLILKRVTLILIGHVPVALKDPLLDASLVTDAIERRHQMPAPT